MQYVIRRRRSNAHVKRRKIKKKLIIENTVESVKKGDLSEFFERFYRADESRNSETGGHGIGLSIAKEIADKSGLKITANSPDGKSIVFTVSF